MDEQCCLGCGCTLPEEGKKLGLCQECRKKLLADIQDIRTAEESGETVDVERLRLLPSIGR